jgi:hypothetical protein
MVERPIKKSERQSQVSADDNPENLDSLPPVESNPKRLSLDSRPPVESNPKVIKRIDDRSSGKGKKASSADEFKQPGNPALARGPKPVKSRPKVIIEPETDSEPTSVEPQGETVEG